MDVDEANELLVENGHNDLRFLDNGVISRPMEGIEVARLPPGPRRREQGKAVGCHLRARGYEPEECIAVGDSIEDLESASRSGASSCVANGPEHDPVLREAMPASPTSPSPRVAWATASTRPSSRRSLSAADR